MLSTVARYVELIAQDRVSEFGVYVDLIEHLEDRLSDLRVYATPGLKECSVCAGFALAVSCAKEFARASSS